MNRGFVKIYRCIEDDILWTSDEPYCKRAAWQDLILLANHSDNEFMMGNQKIIVRRGQHWTSLLKLSQRWHWGKNKVKAFLGFLEQNQKIWLETTNRGCMITLINYGKYQDFKTPKVTPMNTPIDTPMNTQKGNKRTTKKEADEYANEPQTIMTKNEVKNEVKNDFKNVKKACGADFFVEE